MTCLGSLRPRLLRLRQVHVHLIPVEVGVVGRAYALVEPEGSPGHDLWTNRDRRVGEKVSGGYKTKLRSGAVFVEGRLIYRSTRLAPEHKLKLPTAPTYLWQHQPVINTATSNTSNSNSSNNDNNYTFEIVHPRPEEYHTTFGTTHYRCCRHSSVRTFALWDMMDILCREGCRLKSTTSPSSMCLSTMSPILSSSESCSRTCSRKSFLTKPSPPSSRTWRGEGGRYGRAMNETNNPRPCCLEQYQRQTCLNMLQRGF